MNHFIFLLISPLVYNNSIRLYDESHHFFCSRSLHLLMRIILDHKDLNHSSNKLKFNFWQMIHVGGLGIELLLDFSVFLCFDLSCSKPLNHFTETNLFYHSHKAVSKYSFSSHQVVLSLSGMTKVKFKHCILVLVAK